MSLEAAIQNLADAINNYAKSYAPATLEVKETKAGKSRSAAPAAEPSPAPPPVAASPAPAPTPAAPPPAPVVEVDPFGGDGTVAAAAVTYEMVVAKLRELSCTPGKSREAVVNVVKQFGCDTVPELAKKEGISFADVLAAANKAFA